MFRFFLSFLPPILSFTLTLPFTLLLSSFLFIFYSCSPSFSSYFPYFTFLFSSFFTFFSFTSFLFCPSCQSLFSPSIVLPYLSSLHFHSLLPPCLVVSLFFHLSSLHSRLYFPFLSSILPSLFSFLFDYPIFLPFSSFICFFVPCFPVLIFPHPAFLPFFLTYPFLTLPLFSYFCLYPCHLSFFLSLCPLSSFFVP